MNPTYTDADNSCVLQYVSKADQQHVSKVGNHPFSYSIHIGFVLGVRKKRGCLPYVSGWFLLRCLNSWNYPSIHPSIFPLYPFCPCQCPEGPETIPAYIWPLAGKYQRRVAGVSQGIHCMLQDTNEVDFNAAHRLPLYVGLTCQRFHSCRFAGDALLYHQRSRHPAGCRMLAAARCYKIHKSRCQWYNWIRMGRNPCERSRHPVQYTPRGIHAALEAKRKSNRIRLLEWKKNKDEKDGEEKT